MTLAPSPRPDLTGLAAYSSVAPGPVPVRVRASSNEAPGALTGPVLDAALGAVSGATRYPMIGGADLAASVGFMVEAARQGIPVLLDGVIAVACGLVADRLAPGAAAWFAAGHRSTEPAQMLALEKLGLVPVLDLGMRLGEGSGAVAAVPVLRSAAAVLRDVALLSDLGL